MNEIIFPSNNPNDAGNFFLQCFESGVQYPLNDDMYGGQLKLFNITRRFEKNFKLFNGKEKIIELESNDSLLIIIWKLESNIMKCFVKFFLSLLILLILLVRLSIEYDDFNKFLL